LPYSQIALQQNSIFFPMPNKPISNLSPVLPLSLEKEPAKSQ